MTDLDQEIVENAEGVAVRELRASLDGARNAQGHLWASEDVEDVQQAEELLLAVLHRVSKKRAARERNG